TISLSGDSIASLEPPPKWNSSWPHLLGAAPFGSKGADFDFSLNPRPATAPSIYHVPVPQPMTPHRKLLFLLTLLFFAIPSAQAQPAPPASPATTPLSELLSAIRAAVFTRTLTPAQAASEALRRRAAFSSVPEDGAAFQHFAADIDPSTTH